MRSTRTFRIGSLTEIGFVESAVLAALLLGASPCIGQTIKEIGSLTHPRREGAGPVEVVLNQVALSPDGKTLASAGHDRTVRLWDLASRKELAVLKTREFSSECVAFSPDGKVIVSGGKAAPARVLKAKPILVFWDLSTKKPETLPDSRDWVKEVAFGSDGRTLAFVRSPDLGVTLWDVGAGKELGSLEGHKEWVFSLAFSPDGRWLASGDEKGTIILWDAATRTKRATLQGHADLVRALAFNPAGDTLASGSYDKTVVLWSVPAGEKRTVIKGHAGPVSSVAFSPDGKTVASGGGLARTLNGDDQSATCVAKLWDADTSKERASLSGHRQNINTVLFTPDGKQLISADYDGTIKMWDLQASVK